MKELFELGHVAHQETPVLADTVAAHGRSALGHVLGQEGKDLLLRFLFRHRGRLHLVDQATAAVRSLVPGIHLVQQFVRLVNGKHGAFNAGFEARAGHDHSNLQQAVGVGLQAGHFTVQPDQVLVGFGKRGKGGVVGF